MSDQQRSLDPRPQGGDAARRPWIAPELRTMRAGSAEAGPNPVSPEGVFAIGSS